MVILISSVLVMKAQEESKFAINVGAGVSSAVGSDADTKTKFSYNVGVSYDILPAEDISFITGLLLVNKGFKTKLDNSELNAFYIQVPLLGAYKAKISDETKLVIKVGPYFAYGIAGSDIDLGVKEIDYFDSDYGCKRFDVGMLAGLAVDFRKITVGIEIV